VTRPRESWWRRLKRTRRISPGGFLIYAAVLSIVFGVAHLFGLRENVSFLSGTLTGASSMSLFWGVVYAALYFMFVLLVPILILAAGIFYVLQRLWPSRPSPSRLTADERHPAGEIRI